MRESIEKLARREKLSLNHVINIALAGYAEWGGIYQSLGLATMSKRLLRELFANLSEERARELGRENGLEEAATLVMFWCRRFDLESVLRTFGGILGRYSGAFAFEHSREGRLNIVVLRHDMGRNASAYYSEYARSVCGLLGMECSVVESEAQVVIHAVEPPISPVVPVPDGALASAMPRS